MLILRIIMMAGFALAGLIYTGQSGAPALTLGCEMFLDVVDTTYASTGLAVAGRHKNASPTCLVEFIPFLGKMNSAGGFFWSIQFPSPTGTLWLTEFTAIKFS